MNAEAQDKRILERIRKLLALAGNNPNKDEREAAMLKAQELMDRYGVEVESLNRLEEDEYLQESTERVIKRAWGDKTNLVLDVVSVVCKVMLLYGWAYRSKRDVHTITFIGREENTVFAGYMFEFLEGEFDRQWKEFQAEEKRKRRVVNTKKRYSFYAGLSSGLRMKIRNARQTTCEETGIVPLNEVSLIFKLYKQRHSESKNMVHQDRKFEMKAYMGGFTTADLVSLNRPLASTNEGRGLLSHNPLRQA